jgi:hypothetical protein
MCCRTQYIIIRLRLVTFILLDFSTWVFKITAAVPSIGFRSFFGLGQSRKDRPQKAEVADARRIRINIQSRLVDPIRHCERSFFAFGSWMAICDENARVLLIDVSFLLIDKTIWSFQEPQSNNLHFFESIFDSTHFVLKGSHNGNMHFSN